MLVAPQHRSREAHPRRVAGGGQRLDRPTAGIGESEELGDLVERLARGVVDGATQLDRARIDA